MHLKRVILTVTAAAWLVAAGSTSAQTPEKPFAPVSGQAGKDVVWVPTPLVLVEKMLDLAQVTASDFVMDLGSGDGRNIIAAAKRGARAMGVEYNPDMVEYAKREAEKAGVAGKALFVQGDMYEADISQASVLALFLLPENLERLVPKFLELKPGTRIVLNTFGIRGWDADRIEVAGDGCGAWCNALLYIVPASVAGTWQFAAGTLRLEQSYQKVSGAFEAGGSSIALSDVKLDGNRIAFELKGVRYLGRVDGDAISGETRAGAEAGWRADRALD